MLCLSMIAPSFASESGIVEQQSVVAVGYSSIAVIKSDCSVWVWGNGAYGMLSPSGLSAPTKIMSNVKSVYNWTAQTDGHSGVPAIYTAILKQDDSLWLIGDKPSTLGGTQNSSTPIKVMDQVAAASAGENTLAILKKDGSLWVCGFSNSEKVMDGVTAVSTCGGTTAAVKTDGSLWMWGDNSYGQLGIDSTSSQDKPVKVLDGVSSVSVCHTHTAAIKTDGSLWMWGDNSYGQLGTGMAYNASVSRRGYDNETGDQITVQYTVQTTPVKVMDQVSSVSVNGERGHSTHAIKEDGSLWCWGDNSRGQLGNGGATTKTVSVAHVHNDGSAYYSSYPIQDVPVKVTESVAAVSGNGGTTAVIKQDGTLWVTGNSVTDYNYVSSFAKVLDGITVPETIASTVGVFSDVPASAYYSDAVAWAVEKGITSGTGDGTFSPDASCTRAQIVTFLYRAVGKPAVTVRNSFTDVPFDSYYSDAVTWAVEKGVTSGTGGGAFSPDADCTRAQIVTFLWRAAGKPAATGDSSFTDVPSDSYYADAVAWAVENNITSGTGSNTFSPDAVCTRSQSVMFFYRCRDMNLNAGSTGSVNPFDGCAEGWITYSPYGEERAELRITNTAQSNFSCTVSFYRLTGFDFVGTVDSSGHATLYDAVSGVHADLVLNGQQLVLTFEDVPNFYFDYSLSRFLGGIQFVFQPD